MRERPDDQDERERPGGLARPPAVLLGILALAFALRAWGLHYGLPNTLARPDEEKIAGPALAVAATGDLHPRILLYPGLLIYVDALVLTVGGAVRRLLGVESAFTGLAWGIAVGRGVTTAFGVATVVVAWWLGAAATRRRAGGVLAALVLATNFLHIRDSHFATVDVTMAFFVAASLLFAVRAADGQRLRDYAVGGVLAGLAAATKYNSGLVGLALGVAAAAGLRARERRRDALVGIAVAFLLALAAFALAAPYSVLRMQATLRELRGVQEVLYVGTGERGLWVHLRLTLPAGFGWPVLVAAVAGSVSLARRRPAAALVLLAGAGVFFAIAAPVRWVFPRYLVPLVPSLAVLAAEGALALAGTSRARLIAVGSVLAVPGTLNAVAFDQLAARPDTRLVAAEWLRTGLERGQRLLLCHGYGVPLVSRVRHREVNCRDEALLERWPRHRYLVTQEHPYVAFIEVHPAVLKRLRAGGSPLATFTPFRAGARSEPRFYHGDAFYLPFAGFDAVERGGPLLSVWDLKAVAGPAPAP